MKEATETKKKKKNGFSLTSTSWENVDPRVYLCPFDVLDETFSASIGMRAIYDSH